MIVERVGEDTWLRCMPIWVVDTLIHLPEWLESKAPVVRDRLLPRAYADDDEAEQEWRRHITPDLEHLFLRRTEIVRKDLGGLQIDPPADDGAVGEPDLDAGAVTFTLKIPGRHLSAWLASLQAGTHAVFLVAGLDATDLGGDPRHETDPEKQLAMTRLLILQELLAMLCSE